MNIKPYDSQIQKLFQSSFYKIPRFQRTYSWDRGNIEEFWADVVSSGKVGHFVGSMVLYRGKNGQDLFVVDGQQRLTTITIFLAALRDIFTEVGEPSLAKGVQGVIERPCCGCRTRTGCLELTSKRPERRRRILARAFMHQRISMWSPPAFMPSRRIGSSDTFYRAILRPTQSASESSQIMSSLTKIGMPTLSPSSKQRP